MSGVAFVIGGLTILFIIGTVFGNWRLNRAVARHRGRATEEPTDQVVQHVKRIVADNRAMNPDDIFMDMTLEDELGTTGDDASDLFQDFAKEFPDVDLSNVDLGLYFGPDGFGLPWVTLRPLRISDLVQAAKEKRWRAYWPNTQRHWSRAAWAVATS